MTCPKNPKKFLWLFPHEGPHDLRLSQIECFRSFTLQWTCALCGTIQWQMQECQETLIRRGFDLEKLREKMSVEGDYGPEKQTMDSDEFVSYLI